MKSITFYALLVSALAAGCSQDHSGVENTADVDGSPERQAYLKSNIEFHLRDGLGGRSVTVGAIEDSEVPGLDRSSFSVGENQYPFLVSKSDEHIVLLAAEPFRNLSADEMAEEVKAQDERELKAAQDRTVTLEAAAANAPVRGNPDAAITIVEFSDFQCPYCRRGFETMEQLLEKHGNDVRLVYMHFPLSNHPWALPSAIASTCAAQQGDDAFWTLHDYYFRNQGEINVGNVVAKSREALAGAGIDLIAWGVCASDANSDANKAVSTIVNQQFELGRQSGVSGTPGFFVNGVFLNGAQPLEAFEKAIEDAKARL